MAAALEWINETVHIPDLLRAAPGLRPVLDRHGLRGCGGPWGPAESLATFARAHDVPLAQLLRELRDSAAQPPAAPTQQPGPQRLADAIYRPFFRAGIAAVLSVGAAWGAWLLLKIAWTGSFRAAGLHEVNAHGHAQIFGWVGLFVMGFAYQAFPRFKHAELAHPRLALASLWLMLAGLVGRSLLEPLAVAWPPLVLPAVAASALETLAVALFVWVIATSWRRAGKPLAVHDWYILAGLGWFVVQAVGETVYLAATLQATGPALIDLVRTWQAPLRDAQVHGFALLLILGVSQRLLPHLYGLPAQRPGRGARALLVLNAAIIGEMAGLFLLRDHPTLGAALWYGSVVLLAGTIGWLVAGWRIFSPVADRERSLKFLRAAYVWLFVSLGMLVLLPAYQHGLLPLLAPDSPAARLGFSHAYYGAVRHAITVGFVSLMIVGVAARVVPTLRGLDPRRLRPLWAPFLLLNTGCALRVVMQTLTDFTPAAFPVAGISGLLEVTGLALWGAHLWSLLSCRPAADEDRAEPLTPDRPLTAADQVGAILELYPQLLPVFLAHGFTPLSSPLLRHTVARHVSLERACRLLGLDVGPFVQTLNDARAQASPSPSPSKGETMLHPTEALSNEHRVIEQVLNCLEVMAQRAAGGELDRDSARQAIDFFRTFADRCHHGKEEEHLFPLLEQRGLPRQGGPTGVMLQEHEMGRRLLAGMERAVEANAAGQFAEQARGYVSLLRSHILKEDTRLFRMAEQILDEADRRALVEAFERVEHEDMHAGTHERYLRIADDLAERFGVPRAAAGSASGHGCGSCGCHGAH